jgi:rubrerythrin
MYKYWKMNQVKVKGGENMGTDDLEEVFLFAIQGEINDRKTYMKLADRMTDTFLKRKLKFLAEEEEKHKVTLEEMYNVYFPQKNIILPKNAQNSELNSDIGDSLQLVEISEKAMDYEKTAQNNYLLLADELSNDQETSVTLTYFAAMEASHYDLLKLEKEYLEKSEGK